MFAGKKVAAGSRRHLRRQSPPINSIRLFFVSAIDAKSAQKISRRPAKISVLFPYRRKKST